jgi:hypothetical protein
MQWCLYKPVRAWLQSWVTVTVYSTSHSSGGSRPVSPCPRGFGPGLPGAGARASRRSSTAIHSGAPSGRPMVGARSIRTVVAGLAGAPRNAAKSGTSAQRRRGCQLVILAREMSAGARPRPVLGTAHQRATTGLGAM